jgi:ribose transport system substrate-binding protein
MQPNPYLKDVRHVAIVSTLVICATSFADCALAQDRQVIAVVPKTLNTPFSDQAKFGCDRAVAEIGPDQVECFFTGPSEHGDDAEQVQIVADLVAKGVDGVAVAPSNAAAMASVLQDARAARIPVLTWDSDVLPENRDLRSAFVGEDQYDIGVVLASEILQRKPNGGTLCIQSNYPDSDEPIQGIRDTLSASDVLRYTNEPLTGQNGWTEVEGCPIYTEGLF